MNRIKSSQLALIHPDSPLPTVEVDIGSIPDSGVDFDDLLCNALTLYAAKNVTTTATIFLYYTISNNFRVPTDSVFIGLAGPKKCLQHILTTMEKIPGVRARFSDYISPHTVKPRIHIQAGKMYRPEDALNWYTAGDEGDTKDGSIQETTVESNVKSHQLQENENTDRANSREPIPTRYRRARADASIGSIRKTIEEVFGLPEGSVALCGPDGKPLRTTAKISTLKKRWE